MTRFARIDRWKRKPISSRRSGRSTVRLFVEALEDRTCPTAGHDVLATAIPIQFDQYHRADAVAGLSQPNETDLYQITLTQNEPVLIGVQSDSNGQSLLSALRIFDSTGHELAVNSFANAPIVFTAPAAGTYYLGVSSAGNLAYDVTTPSSGSGGTTSGAYHLRIVDASPDSDGNVSGGAPTDLSFGAGNEATAAAAIDSANDVDTYRIYLTHGHEVRFFADLGAGNSLDVVIGLADPQGMQRFSFDQSQTGTNGTDLGTLFTAPQDGYYLVTVRASSRFSQFGAGLNTPGFIGATAGPYVLHVVDDPPDLVTTSFQVLSSDIQWGQTIQVRYTVTNQGAGAAAPFDVQFRLSGDTTFDATTPAVDVAGGGNTVRFASGLGVGQSIDSIITLQLPSSPPASLAGSPYLFLGAVVDSSNEITEASEANDGGQKLGGDFSRIAVTLEAQEAETANATPGSNDARASAEPIRADSDVTGTLAAGDVDWYSFVGTPGRLAVDLESSTPGFSARLALYDSSGTLLIDSDDSPNGSALVEIRQYLATSGIFYLAVSARSGNSATSSYVLRTRLDDASAPNQPLPIAAGPANYFLITADLNRDGIPDLVVGSRSGGAVTVYLGDPLGGFGAASTLAGAAGIAAAAADFNGDGITDLALVNDNSGTLFVLLGRGDGTFDAPSAAISVPLPFSANSAHQTQLTVTDMDHDGHLDVVVSGLANYGASTVSVAFGRGDGTFDPTPWTILSLNAVGTAVADIDGDGFADIAVATRSTFSNPGSEEIAILENDGHRGFFVTSTVSLDADPTSIAAADLDGDGTLDLAVTEQRTVSGVVNGAVAEFFGDGRGGFGPQTILAVGDAPVALAIRDVDGDGRLDLVVANSASNDVSVLLGIGGGIFAPERRFVTGPTPTALAPADFDGDGFLDIATANTGSGDIRILHGRGAGAFTLDDPFRAGTGPVSLADGDFNRDGFLDVVTANKDSDTISILLNRGDGTFVSGAVYATGSQPTNIAVGDLNGDGRLDLVVTDLGAGAISVFLGLGDGTFLQERRIAIGFAPGAIAIADLDGDGHLDIAMTNQAASTATILFGLGDGRFGAPVNYGVGVGSGPTTSEIAAADFNGDHVLDLAIDDGSKVTLLYGNPSAPGTFLVGVTVTTGTTGRLSIGDVNGDGLSDLIVASQINPVSVLFSQGMSGFASPQTLAIGGGGIFAYNGSFALADFDEDGSADLAITSSSMLAVAGGVGNGTFRSNKILANGSFAGAQTSLVGDFNHDGHLDVLAVDQATNDLVVELGLGDGTFVDVAQIGGAQRLSQPVAEDVDGDGLVDSFALSRDGKILFRRGQATGDSPFGPPTVVNYAGPARAFTTLTIGSFQAVAAANTNSDAVSIYIYAFGNWVEPPGSLPTGALPSRVLAADLDGDGRDDLIIADNLDDTVTVAFQQPDGTFSAMSPIPVGVAPSDLAFVHSALGSQIVVADRGSGDVSVLTFAANRTLVDSTRFRAGGGEFDEVANSASDYVVHSLNLTTNVVVGSFDSDAYPDTIAVNQGTDSFSVLRGDRDGGYSDPQPSSTFATGADPSVAVVGDFNGDGHDDLALLMEGSGEVWIYLGDGADGFTHTRTIAVGNAPNGLTSFRDPSGPIDLQVANEFGDILNLRGDGHGNFAIDRSRLVHVALAVADLGNDGGQDVVVANQSLDHVSVLLRQPGQDAFQTNQTIVSGSQPILAPGAVAITDLNGDGLPDMIVANELGNSLLVYPGVAGGTFAPPERYAVGFDPVGITIGDLNGDGIPDLAVPNKGSNDVSILLGRIDSSTGAWIADYGPRLNSGGAGPINVTIADANRDGIPDLLVANQNGGVADLPGTGGGFFNDVLPKISEFRGTITDVSGDLFVIGGGNIARFDTTTFLFVTVYDGGGVVTASEAGDFIVAGLDGQTVAVLGQSSNGLFEIDHVFENFSNEVSALAVLQSGGSFEIYVSQVGQDVPTILSVSDFTSLLTVSLPNTEIEAIATTSGGGDLTVVAAISFKTVSRSDDEPTGSDSMTQFVTTTAVDSGFGFPADETNLRLCDARVDFGDAPFLEPNEPSNASSLPTYEEYQLDLKERLRLLMLRYREMSQTGTDGAKSSASVADSGLSKIIVLEPEPADRMDPALDRRKEIEASVADDVAAPRNPPLGSQPSLVFFGLSLLTLALNVAEPKVALRRTGFQVIRAPAKCAWPAEQAPRRGRTIRARMGRIRRGILICMRRHRRHRADAPKPRSL